MPHAPTFADIFATPEQQPGYAKQFNQGADARLAGRSVWANPYTDEGGLARRAWANGWRHCHVFWGVDLFDWRRSGWRHRELPVVRETASDVAAAMGLVG